MKQLFLLIILALVFTSCRTKQTSIEVSGLVSCEGDSSVLVHPFITRISDGKTFVGDETGHYSVKAVRGDALAFSYVGTISDTIKVENKRLDVNLKLYIPGEDETVYVDSIRRLQNELTSFVEDKDARIGIAVIINGKDTVSVNGSKDFPMLSVYKFPQAIAVADYCHRHNISLNDTIEVVSDELKPDTWSPMRDRYGKKDLSLQLSEILAYSVVKSDNNACDILFRLIGGPQVADSLIKTLGYDEIHIQNTEAEMHIDPYLCYANRATPLQMAALFDRFYRQEMRHDTHMFEAIGAMMMQCNTGNNRLPSPLMPTNAVIGHKTGTGDINSQGRIIGVNDAGYVFLPNRQGYAIAVFIADSGYDMSETEKLIAQISEIVFNSFINSK